MDTDEIQAIYDMGMENVRATEKSADVLRTESRNLLNFLIAGLFGVTGYIAHLCENAEVVNSQLVASFVTALYLLITAYFLVVTCLKARPISPPANDPKCLLDAEREWPEIFAQELLSLQQRIDRNRERNLVTGIWLNWIRNAVFLTPVVFVLFRIAWPSH